MARRKRYKDLEKVLTRVLLADVALFAVYLLFAGLGLVVLKVITAIIAIAVSGLSLWFLHQCGELKKARSRWLVLGFACTAACILVSLILNYPSPAPEAADAAKTAAYVYGIL